MMSSTFSFGFENDEFEDEIDSGAATASDIPAKQEIVASQPHVSTMNEMVGIASNLLSRRFPQCEL